MRKLIALFVLFLAIGTIQAQTTIEITDSTQLAQENMIKPADNNAGFIAKIASWYTNHLNYANVTILMTLESSFIPFPSEIVVPPAAYAACQAESPLYTTHSQAINVLLVVLFATFGAILGAIINYLLSYFLGRPFIYWFVETKFGHLCMLNSAKVQKAEDYFVKHGNASTFVGRLVPVIRQLISIPAGLSKMKIAPFLLFTTLGATIWNILLAVLGYIAHGQQDLINQYSDELSWILLAIGGVFVIYLIFKGIKKKKSN